jgi:tetratricopeptide (TPR) repeat protein
MRLARPAPSPPRPAPAPRPAYLEALGLYERGLEALQRRDFDRAAAAFQDVLTRYPEERELHERTRLYLKVCERERSAARPVPRTPEERLFAATVSMNAGEYGTALDHLRAVQSEEPDNDHAEYMLAVIGAVRENYQEALAHLRRAIELNPENRGLARHDPDLQALRGDETFRLMVEPAPGPAPVRRRRPRPAR